MNYEKKYKEALVKLKEHFTPTSDGIIAGISRELIEDIFPELRESEDEKIKKEIINYINFAESNNLLRIDDYEKKKGWIAWLEKQSTPQVRTGLEWLNTIDDACDKRYAEEYAHGEYCHEQSFKWGFQEGVDWLEKQGEQKPTLPKWKYKKDNTPLLRDSIILNKYGCVAKSPSGALVSDVWVIDYDELIKLPKEEIEKQGEQKPANKVEPKFKVGDTIVEKDFYECGYGTIKDIKDGQYIFTDGSSINIDEQEEWQLSTNVEAKFKVGDWIIGGIYNKPTQITKIEKEGYVTDRGWVGFSFVEDMRLWILQDAKDGDILVSKYNKPFIYNGNRNFFHVGSYCGLSVSGKFIVSTSKCFWTGNVNIRPATKEKCDLLFKRMEEAGYEWDSEHKQLKKIETMDKYEGLTDFERTLTDICIGWIGEEIGWKQYIKDNADILLKIAVEMFNSVQDATFEQKPAEWSEEDEEFLRRAIKATKDIYPVTADWLKSLKPQNHWKPTKEQMEALHDLNLTGNISYAGQGQVLIELYNDLKKL